jgi:hypothetical protein
MFEFIYNQIQAHIENNFKFIDDYRAIKFYNLEIERIEEGNVSVEDGAFYISISPLQRDLESIDRTVQVLNGIFTIYYAYNAFGGISNFSEVASDATLLTAKIADHIYKKFQDFRVTDQNTYDYRIENVSRTSVELIPTKSDFYFIAVSFDLTLIDNSVNYYDDTVTIQSITAQYGIAN